MTYAGGSGKQDFDAGSQRNKVYWRLMKAAITKHLAHRKEKQAAKQKSGIPRDSHGKQTVKQLIGQNQGVSNIEITDPPQGV